MIFEYGMFVFKLTVIYCSKAHFKSSRMYTSAKTRRYDAEIAFSLHFHCIFMPFMVIYNILKTYNFLHNCYISSMFIFEGE